MSTVEIDYNEKMYFINLIDGEFVNQTKYSKIYEDDNLPQRNINSESSFTLFNIYCLRQRFNENERTFLDAFVNRTGKFNGHRSFRKFVISSCFGHFINTINVSTIIADFEWNIELHEFFKLFKMNIKTPLTLQEELTILNEMNVQDENNEHRITKQSEFDDYDIFDKMEQIIDFFIQNRKKNFLNDDFYKLNFYQKNTILKILRKPLKNDTLANICNYLNRR